MRNQAYRCKTKNQEKGENIFSQKRFRVFCNFKQLYLFKFCSDWATVCSIGLFVIFSIPNCQKKTNNFCTNGPGFLWQVTFFFLVGVQFRWAHLISPFKVIIQTIIGMGRSKEQIRTFSNCLGHQKNYRIRSVEKYFWRWDQKITEIIEWLTKDGWLFFLSNSQIFNLILKIHQKCWNYRGF